MKGYRLLRDAEHRIAEIYHYTFDRWGEDQADRYYQGLFDAFEAIASRNAQWRQLPAELGLSGYFYRYERHLIYWRMLEDNVVGIVTVLRERMSHGDLLREAFEV